MIDYQETWASNKMLFAWAFKTRVRVSRVSKNNWLTWVLWNAPTSRILRQIIYYVTGHSFAYNGRAHRRRIMEISATSTHSEPINKPLVDELMDFPDIIYRNYNYVENLHATSNNENKNIIFTQQFYIPKQLHHCKFHESVSIIKHELLDVNCNIILANFFFCQCLLPITLLLFNIPR